MLPHSHSPDLPDAPPAPDDFVCVATGHNATEAHLLQGLLRAAGLNPTVADAHLVQAHEWLTQAAGGVRVRVPAVQAEAAQQVIADYRAGHLALEGEDCLPRPAIEPQAQPLYSPDRAALWSLLLTPLFGATLLGLNSRSLQDRRGQVRALLWWVLLGLLTAAGIAIGARWDPSPWLAFRTSLMLMFPTGLWYFLVAQPQSRDLIQRHGTHYRRRSALVPAVFTAGLMALLGWGLGEVL